MRTKTLATVILLFILFSCKKNDNKSNCDKTMASIAGTYSIAKVELGLNGSFTDFTSTIEDCNRDDRLSLNSNGTTSYQDLGVKCSPPADGTGTWSISSAGKITITDNTGGASDVSQGDITSYDCSLLVITEPDPSGDPGSKTRVTFKK